MKQFKTWFTPGTPACAIAYAVIGAVIAALLLAIGFWKTLFILAFAAVGALLGGVGNKQDAVREIVNKRFPSKDEPIKSDTVRDEPLKDTVEKILEKEHPQE